MKVPILHEEPDMRTCYIQIPTLSFSLKKKKGKTTYSGSGGRTFSFTSRISNLGHLCNKIQWPSVSRKA